MKDKTSSSIHMIKYTLTAQGELWRNVFTISTGTGRIVQLLPKMLLKESLPVNSKQRAKYGRLLCIPDDFRWSNSKRHCSLLFELFIMTIAIQWLQPCRKKCIQLPFYPVKKWPLSSYKFFKSTYQKKKTKTKTRQVDKRLINSRNNVQNFVPAFHK